MHISELLYIVSLPPKEAAAVVQKYLGDPYLINNKKVG